MHRYAASVEYDGSGFCGWQSQIGVHTVQDAVEQALSKVAAHSLRVVVAGRTDTAVHATAQMIHFETNVVRSDNNWLRGVNTYLPDGVCLHWVKSVDSSFHARFSARRRSYRYIVCKQRMRPGILRNLVTWDHRCLNIDAMRQAATHLIGKHNFNAYRAASCQSKTPVKEIYNLSIGNVDKWCWIDVEANGFLHHMVRNIVGVLMTIGAGDRSPDWSLEILRSEDRRRGGVTALPNGLYLTKIQYDDQYELPDTPSKPRFW
ncbi:MAG: tRNA pseudouridine38-40 synthase [Parasphingorhabdus sp.]|jgi:tRNA pseudouridine38-40 synthase